MVLGVGCAVLLENQAVETMDFVLGSQVGLQKWKHLETVIFTIFSVSMLASICVYFCYVNESWFLRASQITKDPKALYQMQVFIQHDFRVGCCSPLPSWLSAQYKMVV